MQRKFNLALAKLKKFISICLDAREARKALAVKLVEPGYLYREIQIVLDVSLGLTTFWKAYLEDEINRLQLNHKGRKSYLAEQCLEV